MKLRFFSLGVGVVGILVAAGATPATRGSLIETPTDWRTHASTRLGLSLRYPPFMIPHEKPDTHLDGYIPQSAPDVQIHFPVSFDDTHITAADVVIEIGTDLTCLSTFGDSDMQRLAGRNFRHSVNEDGASGNLIRWEEFCGMYRGKIFVIKTVVQTYKFEAEDSTEFISAAERRQREAEMLLLEVVRTLVLNDPAPGAVK
jgi:hypothetical protein